ncbi:CAP-Gly domain-containing linker protein 2-like [Pollicipes pollicipes]|uniref:CAP-Gly domain-containing linker protein 2-like n=1 Tax=Pollicipes pollicipes TaxID=41117 RepID=UPI0018855C3D|nr:CAP-Gly domain-containing linker protein 2-like [Pollicipes pollicipes]
MGHVRSAMDDYEHLRKLSEAGVARRISSELVLTADTDSFMVGEPVWVGGTLPGKIAYIGETKFGSGDWAGVVLERPFVPAPHWNGSAGGEPAPPPRPGDRVAVSSSTGRRTGTVCYVGRTEFADGVWVGMTLDEARGRNDGSVAGKRYFDCRPNHGLFAPLHRVTVVQRRPSSELDRRRSQAEFRRDLHVADEDGYY